MHRSFATHSYCIRAKVEVVISSVINLQVMNFQAAVVLLVAKIFITMAIRQKVD